MAKRKITWTNGSARVRDIVDWPDNPRKLTEHEAAGLDASLEEFGYVEPVVLNKDGSLIGGHMRKLRMLERGLITMDSTIDTRYPNRQLTATEARRLALRLNRNTGSWDMDMLANKFDLTELFDVGFEKWEFGMENDPIDPNRAGAGGGEGGGGTGGSGGDTVTFAVLVSKDTKELLFRAINQAKAHHELDTTEEALRVIADDYTKRGI